MTIFNNLSYLNLIGILQDKQKSLLWTGGGFFPVKFPSHTVANNAKVTIYQTDKSG